MSKSQTTQIRISDILRKAGLILESDLSLHYVLSQINVYSLFIRSKQFVIYDQFDDHTIEKTVYSI